MVHKLKEYLIIILIAVWVGAFFIFENMDKVEAEVVKQDYNPIVIDIDGEVVRKTQVVYLKQLTYETLFYRIKNICNEYSDLSGFDLTATITSSLTVTIPSLDLGNNYQEELININLADQKELMKLSQIGEKRSQKIIEYRQKKGPITSFEILWKIINVSAEAKELIKKHAILS